MKTEELNEIKQQFEEQISDMFQTPADFSDTPLKDWWIDGWSDLEAIVDDKCYVSYFKITGFEKVEVKTAVGELLYVNGEERWFPMHEQIDLEDIILELLIERFENLQP